MSPVQDCSANSVQYSAFEFPIIRDFSVIYFTFILSYLIPSVSNLCWMVWLFSALLEISAVEVLLFSIIVLTMCTWVAIGKNGHRSSIDTDLNDQHLSLNGFDRHHMITVTLKLLLISCVTVVLSCKC